MHAAGLPLRMHKSKSSTNTAKGICVLPVELRLVLMVHVQLVALVPDAEFQMMRSHLLDQRPRSGAAVVEVYGSFSSLTAFERGRSYRTQTCQASIIQLSE